MYKIELIVPGSGQLVLAEFQIDIGLYEFDDGVQAVVHILPPDDLVAIATKIIRGGIPASVEDVGSLRLEASKQRFAKRA